MKHIERINAGKIVPMEKGITRGHWFKGATKKSKKEFTGKRLNKTKGTVRYRTLQLLEIP